MEWGAVGKTVKPSHAAGTMIDVLFTHSYFLRFDAKQWEAAKPYPPLGTIYAAAEVRSHGYTVALHDTMLEESEESLELALDRHMPNLLVIYDDGFNYLTKMCLSRMREAALRMVRIARRRGLPVVVSSSDGNDHADRYLAEGATVVIAGEGETTLSALVPRLIGEPRRGASSNAISFAQDGIAPLHDIPGVVFREPGGGTHRTPARELMLNLDLLLPPAWDLVDVERYRTHWMRRHGRFSLNVSTTRGCPYRCNWCAKPIYGNRYTVRTPASVAEEWVYLKRELRPDHLWITDDIFGLKPRWVERFRDELIARDAIIPFNIQARVDLLGDETVRALREAGCEMVWVGAESGAQSVLDAMEKGTQVGQIEAAAERLRAAGIKVGFFLQFGYPGEGWDEIHATIGMVRRLMPDDIGISVSYPLPGTTFYERVQPRLGEKRNWVDSDDLDPIYPSLYDRAFYRALHRRVHAEFRARRGWGLLRRSLRGDRLSPAEGRAVLSGIKQTLLLPLRLLKLRSLRRPLPHAVMLAPLRDTELATPNESEAVLSS